MVANAGSLSAHRGQQRCRPGKEKVAAEVEDDDSGVRVDGLNLPQTGEIEMLEDHPKDLQGGLVAIQERVWGFYGSMLDIELNGLAVRHVEDLTLHSSALESYHLQFESIWEGSKVCMLMSALCN